MRVDLEQALSPEDLGPATCALCERPFVVESVYAWADVANNSRALICPECIEYLGSRSEHCPTVEHFRELLEKHPRPVWENHDDFHRYMMEASPEEQERVYASVELTWTFLAP